MSVDQAVGADARRYPERPILGIAGVVLHDDRVLLIQRGREPMKGAWSLPGGALKLSEDIPGGVIREVQEETGLSVRPIELVEVFNLVSRDESGRVRYHYVVLDWLCTPAWLGAAMEAPALKAGSDALSAVWANLDALERFHLDPATLRVIQRSKERSAELGL